MAPSERLRFGGANEGQHESRQLCGCREFGEGKLHEGNRFVHSRAVVLKRGKSGIKLNMQRPIPKALG
jgi:hypothetical protein